MSTVTTLVQSDPSHPQCKVAGSNDDTINTKLWFKTGALSREFCYRVAQLQLCTTSRDQGWVGNNLLGSWSWFEVIILETPEATEPKVKDGRTLAWRSHSNRIGIPDLSRHFGLVFDRRGELLDDLEVGNAIGVRLCVRFPGWRNVAEQGYIKVKVLNEDLFTPQSWTLDSVVMPKSADAIENVFTLLSTNECHLKSNSNELTSRIWFTSPAMDEDVLSRMEDVQLFTYSHDQGNVDLPEAGRWSWFDIVVLESPLHTSPKVLNGVELVWSSHVNRNEGWDYITHEGITFDCKHDLLRSLQIGNAIAVRVCAQFEGWTNSARSGRLVIRATNIKKHVPVGIPNLTSYLEENIKFQETVDKFYSSLTPDDLPSYQSATSDILLQPLRADLPLGLTHAGEAQGRPLRLLSLDGGGVRGVSPLRILEDIVKELPGGLDAQPCNFFDMISGTSTGGLIAIMLGRLEMTLGDCMDHYKKLSKLLFNRWKATQTTSRAWNGARYDAGVLETYIKNLVKDKLGNQEALLFDEKAKCKIFVVTVPTKNATGPPTLLRNYINPRKASESSEWTIWQAARATSAAPTYFDQLQFGDRFFVDGGLGYNNPVFELKNEAACIFGVARSVGCLLSLGTGVPPDTNLPRWATLKGVPTLIEGIIAIASTSERAHETMQESSAAFPLTGELKYCRLNVGHLIAGKNWQEGGEWLELDDWKDIDRFIAVTEDYLKQKDVQEFVKWCVLKLKDQ